jgi:hypothetical protein
LQVFDNTCGEHVGRWQGISAFKALVTQLEEIETDFIALEQFIVAERVEAFAFLS